MKLAGAFPKSRFVGVDCWPRVIEMAKEGVNRSGLEGRVEFKVLDATELGKSVADCIILNEVLHEMAQEKRLAAMKACRSALKSKGVLFLLDIIAPDDNADYSKEEFELSAVVQFFETPWGSKLLTRSELDSLMHEAGFPELHHIAASDNVFAAYVMPR